MGTAELAEVVPGSARLAQSRIALAREVQHHRELSNAVALATGVGVLIEAFGGAVMYLILLVVLVLLLLGAVPAWPHSRSWGYYPSGGIGLVLIIVLLLFLFGGV